MAAKLQTVFSNVFLYEKYYIFFHITPQFVHNASNMWQVIF